MLLREVAGPRSGAATEPVAKAVASLELGAGVVVIASPHGRATGVYAAAGGDLDAFGPRGISVDAPSDEEIVHTLAAAWDRPVLDGVADHGVVVPLRLLRTGTPVVAAAFREENDAAGAAEEGTALADALGALDVNIAFVASANLSPRLTEGAPLAFLEGAAAADERVLHALRTHPVELLDVLDELADAGSCAVGPLAAFASLFPARACSVRAYAHPFGVGHVVAVTS